MKSNLRHIATLAIALTVIASVVAMPAAAELTSAPTVDDSSDITDGATLSLVDASDGNNSTLVANTDTADTIASADATISLADEDRDYTVYSADDMADEYSVETDIDTTGDGSADSDQHTWNITHDEFADVPVAYNGTTDLDFTVEVEDDTGDTANVTGTVTVQNDGNRSVIVADSPSIDADNIGPDISTSTDEVGTLASYNPFSDAEDRDVFELSDTRSIGDANTTIEVHAADSDMASSFDEQLSEPDDGDVVLGQTATVDDGPIYVFYNEADTDLVNESEDTYVVYDNGTDVFTYHLGDDYDSSDSVDVFTASNNALYNEFDVSADDVAESYSDLSFSQLSDEFGSLSTIWTLDVWPFSLPF